MVTALAKQVHPRIFLCYASEDTAAVGRLWRELEDAGAVVVIDQSVLSPGDLKWQKTIRRSIASVDALIYVASKEARNSTYATAEIALAMECRKKIFAFWLRGDRWIKCAPFELREAQYIDARRGNYQYGLSKLIEQLGLKEHDEEPGTDGEGASQHTVGKTDEGGLSEIAKANLIAHGRLTAAQIDAALEEIQALQQQGHIDEAVAACDELVARNVYRADVSYIVGFLYQAVERWSDAIKLFLVSRYDPEYAVLSCYALGQCASALGDMEQAAEYFNQAIDQINANLLGESDANLLINICFEAAQAYRKIGDYKGAEDIINSLIAYLRRQQWEAHRLKAESLKEKFKKKWPYVAPRHRISESRPLEEHVPQRTIDPIDYFAWPPISERGADNLKNAGGIWPTPPRIPIVNPSDTGSVTEPEVPSGDTQPITIVQITAQMKVVKPTPADEAVKPADLLEEVLDSIFGPNGNLHEVLERMQLTQRGKVARALNWIKDLLTSGQLIAACGECVSLLTIAQEYFNIFALLAEIYVRLDQIDEATQQYIKLAGLCVEQDHIDDAVATYQRILQLAPHNISHRNRLYELQTQVELTKRPTLEQNNPATERPADGSLTFLLPMREPRQASLPDSSSGTETSVAGVATRPDAQSDWFGGKDTLQVSSLVDHDALPQWIRDVPPSDIQDATDALRQIQERVASEQLDAAGAMLEQAKLVQRFRASNQNEHVICVLREMARSAPDNVTIHSQLASVLIAQGYLEDGSAEFRLLASLYEDRNAKADAAQVYQSLAELAWSARNHEETIKWQRQAICCTTEDIPQRQKLVKYCLEMGRRAEAIEQQKLIVHYYYLNRESCKSIAAAQQLIAMDRENLEAYDLLSQIYFSMGEYRKAERVYRNLAKVAPTHPLVRARLRESAARRAQDSHNQSER